jgi:hypothetical protein
VLRFWRGNNEGKELVVPSNFFAEGAHRGEGSMVGGLDGGGKRHSDGGESQTVADNILMLLL